MNIDTLIDAAIAREGGYVDHPKDRGGPTNWGVTEQVARAFSYVGDMRAMPRALAVTIYRERYWTAPGFGRVVANAPRIAEELFDIGINMGPATGTKMLQRALNLLNREASDYPDMAVDGRIGNMTLFALAGYRAVRKDAEGEAVLLWMIRAFRTGRYAEIAEADRSQEAFQYGWVARQVRMAA